MDAPKNTQPTPTPSQAPALLVALIVVLLGGAAGWYFFIRKAGATSATTDTASAGSTTAAAVPAAPVVDNFNPGASHNYRVTGAVNFGGGSLMDANKNPVPIQSFAPKLGDTVSGPLVSVPGQSGVAIVGIRIPILLAGQATSGFIPLTSLTQI